MADKRGYDLVVFGATGDAGRAMATLLAEHAASRSKSNFRWTIAGRSEAKLEAIRSKVKLDAKPLLADCADDAALRELASRTRVLVSAAGPYHLLGERVLASCIESKTHYVDITGEVPWVAEMKRKYNAAAVAAGVCIASFCGYDCVPAEISLFLGRQALASPLAFAESVLMPADGGGAPRGTLLTSLALMHNVPSMMSGLANFVPPEQRWPMGLSLLTCLLPRWSSHVGGFTLPHFMFWCNTPIVHASSACVGSPGEDAGSSRTTTTTLRYRDAMMLPLADRWYTLWGLLPIVLIYLGLAVFGPLGWVLLAIPPVKSAAQRLLLGAYSYSGDRKATTVFRTAVAAPPAAATIELKVPGDGGIFATALLALACGYAMLDVLDDKGRGRRLKGGLCTPVEALGDVLVSNLQSLPGVTLDVLEVKKGA